MADSLESLLAGRKKAEPPEIAIIKSYVHDMFSVTPDVSMSEHQIIIGVKSSALAGALRPHLLQIKDACQTDKRLLIRIK